MTEKTKCLDCEHFDQKADESLYPDAGLCRASTPIMANSSNVWGRWPAVNSNDWCGKAVAKKVEECPHVGCTCNKSPNDRLWHYSCPKCGKEWTEA